jgi:hypothetical protein
MRHARRRRGGGLNRLSPLTHVPCLRFVSGQRCRERLTRVAPRLLTAVAATAVEDERLAWQW